MERIGLAREPSSFRDPSGHVFRKEGHLLRQINRTYSEEWDLIRDSGFLSELQSAGLLVRHDEIGLENALSPDAYTVIRPDEVSFISYPYEWCFSQFRDAALATLEIQKRALDRGFTLKDASAYNIQFASAKPLLIDTLSFERYEEGEPWVAYKQFCEHFLAPLALAAKVDSGLMRLGALYIDGIPLPLASKLLPKKTRWNLGLAVHIHAHAGAQAKGAVNPPSNVKGVRISLSGLKGLIASLESTVKGLSLQEGRTTWSNYYAETSYSDVGMQHKIDSIAKLIDSADLDRRTVWDLGANTGRFSRVAAERGLEVVAFDLDQMAVEFNYRQVKSSGEARVLPLVMDLSNPSQSLGWAHEERRSLEARGPCGLLLALALVHHLAIGNNVPLDSIAQYFSRLCEWAIVEFVPKDDPQTQRLLATREDVFPSFTQAGFSEAFGRYFVETCSVEVPDSNRTIHLFKRKGK